MKAYWDSSALIQASVDISLRARLQEERGVTRTHAIAETFSALTGGNLGIRVDPDQAALALENLAKDLEFVDLTAEETLHALKKARQKGVRGGRVHDFLHAVAAAKSGVARLVTVDQNDFNDLIDTITVEQV